VSGSNRGCDWDIRKLVALRALDDSVQDKHVPKRLGVKH
jgi:hypothetical protein